MGWPPGLGEDRREMKDGSLERAPGPGGVVDSSCGDNPSWSGEDREGEWQRGGDLDDKDEEGAAASGDEGETGPAAAEVDVPICLLLGRWAADTFLGPWLVETRFLRGAVLLGSGLGTADRRQLRFWFRCSSWHWAPRGQVPLREKSGHSRVCFFLHLAPMGQ